MGDVRDFSNFFGAVIDERAFDKHKLADGSCNWQALAADQAVAMFALRAELLERDPPKDAKDFAFHAKGSKYCHADAA